MDRTCAPSFTAFVTMMALAALLVAAPLGGVDAYVLSSSLRRSSTGKVHAAKKAGPPVRTKRREDGSAVKLYLFPVRHSASATGDRRRGRSGPPDGLPAMSDSVLAESDTLPAFRTAHGLLSPEVVSRIADARAGDLEGGEPLHRFLKTYKQRGPMACLHMLSDPCVLPELTKAMREIA